MEKNLLLCNVETELYKQLRDEDREIDSTDKDSSLHVEPKTFQMHAQICEKWTDGITVTIKK